MIESDAADAGVPASLRDPGLDVVWRAVRQRLDRDGDVTVRSMAMPPVESRCSPTLAAVLDRPVTKRLDLKALEAGLLRLGVEADLDAALTRLGHPPDQAAVRKRETRARSKRARQALEGGVAGWPESWAAEWAGELRRSGLVSGLDADGVGALLDSIRRLVELVRDISGESGVAAADHACLRTEIAAQFFGSAHALDAGTRLGVAAERALRYTVDGSQRGLEGKALWEAAGISTDSVSAPALTWGLRPLSLSPLARMLGAAAEGRLPLHVSLRSLREHRLEVACGTAVLVVENPSVIEAAMASQVPFGLVCTNGNPSAAVAELVSQLVSSGATLGYHGDFDAVGIAICRRMTQRGCRPWRMGAPDYVRALDHAEAAGVKLLRDAKPCGPTPWDPRLESEFGRHRLIVHEESVIDDFLLTFAG